jgi:hypothetical protein
LPSAAPVVAGHDSNQNFMLFMKGRLPVRADGDKAGPAYGKIDFTLHEGRVAILRVVPPSPSPSFLNRTECCMLSLLRKPGMTSSSVQILKSF